MDTAGRVGNRVLTLIDGVRSNDIYSAGPASYGRDSFEIDDFIDSQFVGVDNGIVDVFGHYNITDRAQFETERL